MDRDIKVMNLDHLGIVAGITDDLGIVEQIRDLLLVKVPEASTSLS